LILNINFRFNEAIIGGGVRFLKTAPNFYSYGDGWWRRKLDNKV